MTWVSCPAVDNRRARPLGNSKPARIAPPETGGRG